MNKILLITASLLALSLSAIAEEATPNTGATIPPPATATAAPKDFSQCAIIEKRPEKIKCCGKIAGTDHKSLKECLDVKPRK
jgi:hypothetical protein